MVNKNINESFITRLFNVIDLPLFILLALVLIEEVVKTNSFYLEYVIYIGIAGFIINVFLYGFAGFRAGKNKDNNVKPWIAGLITAFIVSVFSLILAVVTIVYFPTPMDTYFSDNMNNNEMIVDEEFEGEVIENEEFEDDFSVDLNGMGQGGWNDPLLNWTLIGGGIGLVFASFFGALCGLIGGAIGKN